MLKLLSEEAWLQDGTNFKAAVEMLAPLGVLCSQANHEAARSIISLKMNLATDAVYKTEHYLVVIGANHSTMEHEVPPEVVKYQRDDSGDVQYNRTASNSPMIDPFTLQDVRNAKHELQILEREIRAVALPPSKAKAGEPPTPGSHEEREQRKFALLKTIEDSGLAISPGDHDRIVKGFKQTKPQPPLVELPLDTKDESLVKYSAAQIKDLLARRKRAWEQGQAK
jgi:hypothetical protein